MKPSIHFPFLALAMLLLIFSNGQAQDKQKIDLRPKLLNQVLRPVQAPNHHHEFALEALKSTYTSWGIDPLNKLSGINLPGAWENFQSKKEIVVAVIDTGIDSLHPFLKDNIIVKEGQKSEDNFGVDFSKFRKYNNRPTDDHGHGTHVSGIIKSVFPRVRILSLKYYNKNASGKDNLSSTISALKYAVDMGVDVINYSGGGPDSDIEELQILKKAESKGIIVIAAAGNEENNIDQKQNAYYPASYGLTNIITVTAHDQSANILETSNYGKKSVDVSAPGDRIKSSLPNFRSGFLTGTSQATAFVSGVVALLKSQFPSLDATQIKEIIKQSAKKEITLVTKTASGGRLDASEAHLMAAKMVKESVLKQNVSQIARPKIKIRDIANKNTFEAGLVQGQRPGQIIYRLKGQAN